MVACGVWMTNMREPIDSDVMAVDHCRRNEHSYLAIFYPVAGDDFLDAAKSTESILLTADNHLLNHSEVIMQGFLINSSPLDGGFIRW